MRARHRALPRLSTSRPKTSSGSSSDESAISAAGSRSSSPTRPVAFSLGIMGVAWLMFEGGSLATAPQRLIGGIDSFPLLAVPLFILSGLLMNASGVSDRIYNFAKVLVGHFTGGLGPRQRDRQPHLLRHVGLGDRRRRRPRRARDQADEEGRLPGGLLGRPHLRVVHHRSARAAVDPDGDLRRDREHVGRRAVRRRHRAGAADRRRAHDLRPLLGDRNGLPAQAARERRARWRSRSATRSSRCSRR